jgi:hypothetical protein
MKITRKQFLNVAAGAATAAAIPSLTAPTTAVAQPEAAGQIKRGVSVYSYDGELDISMTLEDCLADIYDMGAKGLEILAPHVEGYPNPSDRWVENWWKMMKKYELTPVQFGHWVDSRMYPGRELTARESCDSIVRDLKLANRLGFTRARTYLGVRDRDRRPVQNWREFIKMALPVAEQLNIKMCSEIHFPTLLNMHYLLDEYVEFIEKEKTKWFGFNMDFSVFQTKRSPGQTIYKGEEAHAFSKPEEIVPFLPYTYSCHAKFWLMTDEMTEYSVPYEEIIRTLEKHVWEGCLLSEYEGANKYTTLGGTSDQLRKHHIMLKKLLGA